jgi:WD40 repeat protein
MVLEKNSSILGYPGEISKPLNADHHDVCKYISQQDPNYISVRDVLSSWVGRFRKKGEQQPHFIPSWFIQSSFHISDIWNYLQPRCLYTTRHLVNISLLTSQSIEVLLHDTGGVEDFKKVEKLLSLSEAPDDDYDFFAERWMPGSCEWILSDASFEFWIEDSSSKPRILWFRGLPGTGKSVLSSFIIRHLKQVELGCQFYFFRFGDQRKTSLNAFLRSLAYQVARDVPEYRRRILKFSDDGLNLEKAESRMIWQKLFVSALFKLSLSKPLFWVIDALDESDSPQTLLSLFSAISNSGLPIRILFVSRRNQSLSLAFERLATSITLENISADDSLKDLQLYVTKEMEYMHGSPKFKEHIIKTILKMADGNFLWVHLVLKEIMQCHTEADIEQALTELPPELEPLYQRMEAALARNSRPADQDLAKTILAWAACSRRSLTLAELSQALLPEYPPVLDLQHTINQVCGEFVLIDSKSNVTMIHQTAREYLTKTSGLRFSILLQDAHYLMFKKCLSFLLDRNLRARVDQVPPQPFLNYAATSWSYHLNLSAAFRDRTSLLILAKFLRGPSVLTWIHVLALASQLRVLASTSKTLTSFLEKRGRVDAEQSPMTHCLQEKETIELWATDLIKIVGKFGTHLVSYPRSIYKLIPPFCPRNSVIHQQFGPKNISSALRVTGFSNPAWDDNLAKFSVGRDCQGLRVMCLDRYFAILISDGTVILYHSMTCEETRRFPHGERVLTMRFSNGGDKLVTYGFRTTKVWNVSSARQMHSIANPVGTKALAIAFAAKDTAILTCSEDRVIRQLALSMPEEGWSEILGDHEFDSNHYNSPRCVAFNPEGTQIAMAYRGFPLSVWRVDFPGLIGRCERPDNLGHNLWTGVDRVCWNPITGHVVGIYSDGCIFKWHPLEDDNQELKTVALEIQCSPDGNLFVTSSADGTLRIWSFHHFALIYQLSCTSPVTDLAIDPDGRRIYDLRESFCNVWEPNALIRLSEADEKASETSSTIGSSAQFSLASEVSAEMLEPITALAVSPRTSTYCAGSDEGILTLSKKGVNEITVLSQSFMAVDHIVWSEDEKTLATADLSGRVTVKSMNLSISTTSERTILQTTTNDSIQQLLLSVSSKYLLVSTLQSVNIWSLDSKSIIASRMLPNSSRKWSNHPFDADLLTCFGFASFQLWKWADLTEIEIVQMDRTAIDRDGADQTPELFRRPSANYPISPSEFENFIDKTFLSTDGSLMLLQTSQASDHRRRKKQFMIIKTSNMAISSSEDTRNPIIPDPLPEEILNRIEMPLGFITSDVTKSFWSLPSQTTIDPAGTHGTAILAFLDKDFWVCTGSIHANSARVGSENGNGSGIKRHFFLPRDWLNVDCLELAVMTKEGVLLCPRNGEVAVVTEGLREEWIG